QGNSSEDLGFVDFREFVDLALNDVVGLRAVAGRVDRLESAGPSQQSDQRILNDVIGCFHPSMIFVRAHFVKTGLIENPAVTQDRRRFDISDLKRDVETRAGRNGRELWNFELIVFDRPRRAAGCGRKKERQNDQTARDFHLVAPPGLRSSTRIPRTRLEGLLLIVSVRLRIFAEDARILSRMSYI